MSPGPAAFYAAPGPMTATDACDHRLFRGLGATPTDLCSVASHLLVHEYLAATYGLPDITTRSDELELRTAADLITAISSRDGRPLAQPRPPERRTIGNCRQFAVLSVALLRRRGIPARARAGFADYFERGAWTDHWLVEHWHDNRWRRVDAQLDPPQKALFGIDFDATDVPPHRFLTGGEAWQRCRIGAEDPLTFGIGELRGEWFIAAVAIRDLAALNKIETHTWDVWGTMTDQVGRGLTEDERQLIDTIAETAGRDILQEVTARYDTDGLRVEGHVRSARTHKLVHIPR